MKSMFNRRKNIVIEKTTPEPKDFFKPTLIFTEDMLLEKEDEYLFRYHANQLPPLRVNQLSVEALQVDASSYPVSIISLFRNTLETSFHIDGLPLLVLDENQQLIGRKVLTTEDIPEFVAMSSIPCWLDFHEDEIFIPDSEKFPGNIQLLFSLEETFHLEMDEELLLEENRRFQKAFYSTPTLQTEELNVLSVSVEKTESEVIVLLLIRNGYNRVIHLDALPLQLYSGDMVVNSYSVEVNKSIEAQTAVSVKVQLDVAKAYDLEHLSIRISK